MGFYYENKYENELIIDSQRCYPNGIQIVNNEEISFNLENFTQINHDEYIHKIVVYYGDGTNQTINKPIKNNEENWKKFNHLFSFKENINEGNIEIKIYNLYGETVTIIIKFQLKHLSLKEQNIEFSLVSANLCNDKKISYIFNNINKNQLILAKNR